MDKLQNSQETESPLKSDLSDFYGTTILPGEKIDSLRKGLDRVVPDDLDITLREYDFLKEGWNIDSLDYGPASAPLKVFELAWFFMRCSTFRKMLDFYHGFAYDSVKFRITASAPKGLVGGFFVGAYPHQPWSDAQIPNQYNYFDTNFMTRQYLTLSPQCNIVAYGESNDVEIEVPWQFNVPHITRQMVTYLNGVTYQPWPGCPNLWFMDAGSRYLTSVSMPAKIRVFVTFDNLRFVAPAVLAQGRNPLDLESDEESEDLVDVVDGPVEALAELIRRALFVYSEEEEEEEFEEGQFSDAFEPQAEATTAAAGAEIVSALTRLLMPTQEEGDNKGNYADPSSVQLSYVGDSSRRATSQIEPALWSFGKQGARHRVIDMLKQNQWIGNYVTPLATTFYGNPTAPTGVPDLSGTEQNCTYFRFFGQMNAYWRGTLFFDILIMGHPMVEVEYKIAIQYPPWSSNISSLPSQSAMLRGIACGVKRITVPIPFMTQQDYVEVIDSTITTDPQIRAYSTASISCEVSVISTALDEPPIIPINVFMRAGEDFSFYQPIPPGYSNVYEAQVLLPQQSTVFETRACEAPPLGNMLAMTHIEDYMEIWSRALPFGAYEANGEPQVETRWGTSPYWYPMNDSGAYSIGTQNSWYVTNDYISLLSSMFLFFNGSISFKVLCVPGQGYKYISLDTGQFLRQTAHNPFTADPSQLPHQANFGFGTVATDLSGQPVLEMTIPFRSTFEWAPTNPLVMDVVQAAWFRTQPMLGQIQTNVTLHETLGDLRDALYRKIGRDFSLQVRGLLPPPSLWITKGNNWS